MSAISDELDHADPGWRWRLLDALSPGMEFSRVCEQCGGRWPIYTSDGYQLWHPCPQIKLVAR